MEMNLRVIWEKLELSLMQLLGVVLGGILSSGYAVSSSIDIFNEIKLGLILLYTFMGTLTFALGYGIINNTIWDSMYERIKLSKPLTKGHKLIKYIGTIGFGILSVYFLTMVLITIYRLQMVGFSVTFI